MDLKTEFTTILDEAVVDAFGIMAVEPKFTQDNINSKLQDGVTSTIFLRGGLIGKVSIFLIKNDAAAVVSKMLGTSVDHADPEVLDGIGEIANLLAGGIKNRSVKIGYNYEISVPSTLVGTDFKAKPMKEGDFIFRNFEADEFKFQVALAYRLKKDAEAVVQEEPKKDAAAMLNALLNKDKQ